MWVRCPAVAANKLAGEGRIKLGWANAKVDNFKIRPTQCFKCWHYNHVRGTCRGANIDRTGRCFRCGGEGHAFRNCVQEVNCIVCADKAQQ